MEEKKVVRKRRVKKVEEKDVCKYCGEEFEKGLTICPKCYKKQKGSALTGVLAAFCTFLVIVGLSYFVSNVEDNVSKEEYVNTCEYVSYNSLIRTPKDYLDKDVAVMGKVVEVNGTDSGYANSMYITINTNMSSIGNDNLVTIYFVDSEYNMAYVKDDIITAYGVYEYINGNIPQINAKFIDLNS